jgi:diaminopimelate decarboxylase
VQSPFQYRNGELHCGAVPLRDIVEGCGTPVYVYSADGILDRFRAYRDSLRGVPNEICYAVKANSNLAVLGLLTKQGAGFDIVSGGELFRVLRAGGDPAKVVFSGVGKRRDEIEYALAQGIHSFNCESESELELLASCATSAGRRAKVAIRVNPDVDAVTHPYISTGLRDHKFGIPIERAMDLYRRAAAQPALELHGVSCHIGSQMLDPAPLFESINKVLAFALDLRSSGIAIRRLDLGGGLGVAYRPTETSPPIAAYAAEVTRLVKDSGLTVVVEPGRSIVAECGALLTTVIARKNSGAKDFVIVDAAMNDLIRPALYQAHHEIIPVEQTGGPPIVADIVGPVCETGDFLARSREVAAVATGQAIALLTAGAYGFVLASNYNSRPRAAEVLVENSSWRIVRERETLEDLIRGESL